MAMTGRGGRRTGGEALPALWRLASLVALIGLWQLVVGTVAPRNLPAPLAVAQFAWAEAATGEMGRHLAATLLRVAAAFTLAMAIGTAIGVAMGRHRGLDRFADTWLIVLLNTPALVITVLCYVWVGLNELAVVLAVAINKIPNVAVTLREGARALDPRLDEIGKVYRFSRTKRLRHIVLPQLAPYVAAAARSGIALIWKIVLVVELLGRSNGVGFAIHLAFQTFDVAAILGYTLAFAAVMLAIEYALVQPLERRAGRWRPAAA